LGGEAAIDSLFIATKNIAEIILIIPYLVIEYLFDFTKGFLKSVLIFITH
jgi:hypothetical protein